jgi:hypothetical protein
MTLAFLAGAPLAMGYFCVNRYLRTRPAAEFFWYEWLFLPWGSVLLSVAVAALLKWEGAICILFASPVMFLFAMIGGIAARVAWAYFHSDASATISVLALPLLLLALELRVPNPTQVRSVHSQILIQAPVTTVWANIKSVHAIEKSELPDSWVQRIGFPDPIAATLSHDGVGGIRSASFTGGLMFTETVTRWEPVSDLRFSIHANTGSIPASTLDEHVAVGGAFFDVLEGEYRLEPLPGGVLLHLSSQERLSTHFNAYAGEWTDAVMQSIQQQILRVIRKRCESDARPSSGFRGPAHSF